jgi:3-dehydroquinate synthase
MPHSLKISVPSNSSEYKIVIGHGLLERSGTWVRNSLSKQTRRVAVISDDNVFGHYGDEFIRGFTAPDLKLYIYLIKGGERRKDLKTVTEILDFLSTSGISRGDAVIALGGGVVGDISGFAAAVHLRGISFLNIPTTLLSMVDASIGGKTGVNSKYGKNLIGAFHQPSGVLIDPSTLKTLPERELTAGLCEMIKQGAISGHALLNKTRDLLEWFPKARFRENYHSQIFRSHLSSMIVAHIAFKAGIVAGDQHEVSGRVDAKSRKILNFGHTLAHALEKVTGYTKLRHGEAVGYGILFAAELSKSLALCSEKDVELLNDVVHRVGTLPSLANIDRQEVFEAFKTDKKHSAGSLQMVLLKGIGKPVIVAENEIPRSTIHKVLKRLLTEWA